MAVVAQLPGARTVGWLPRGAPRVDARSDHIVCGMLLADVAAKGTHHGLHGLLAAMLVAGMFLAWTRGDSIFSLSRLPADDPDDKSLPHHAAAALVHRCQWHDGVLRRMLPRS